MGSQFLAKRSKHGCCFGSWKMSRPSRLESRTETGAQNLEFRFWMVGRVWGLGWDGGNLAPLVTNSNMV